MRTFIERIVDMNGKQQKQNMKFEPRNFLQSKNQLTIVNQYVHMCWWVWGWCSGGIPPFNVRTATENGCLKTMCSDDFRVYAYIFLFIQHTKCRRSTCSCFFSSFSITIYGQLDIITTNMWRVRETNYN